MPQAPRVRGGCNPRFFRAALPEKFVFEEDRHDLEELDFKGGCFFSKFENLRAACSYELHCCPRLRHPRLGGWLVQKKHARSM